MSTDEAAARLIERVLSDPAFRARFRRDPAAAAREAGLDPVDEPAADRALETLELRESKSSLAGALMAAAVEGVGLYDLVDHLASGSGHGRDAVARALSGIGVDDAEAAAPRASPEALALLQDRNIEFDPDGVADLRAGRIDQRIVAVLGEVAKHHQITVSAMRSDHPELTAGGAVSNHASGRAVDIAAVDGRPVSPGNAAARELAAELLRLDPAIRPTELGSPWALRDPAAFTDGDHQDHIHVAFDDPAASDQARVREGSGAGAVVAEPDDDSAGDDDTDSDDEDDDADDDSDDEDDSDDNDEGENPDGDDDETDGEDDSDDGETDDEDDEDEDEDEDEPDEQGPDEDDLTDDERGADGGEDHDSDDQGDGDAQGDGDQDDGGDQGDQSEPDLGDVGSEYPGDSAPRGRVALWMAAEAQRRGLPAELPVMAALVESGMRNLPGGDADSVGFFQMRAGIWNTGPYAGYGDRPELQLDWFLDHAEAVRRQRVARGLSVKDPAHYGDWIADIERPAEQYRGRYQLRLADARELLRHKAPPEELVGAVDGAAPVAGPRALAALAEARRYLGTPYRWGGSTPQTGFDCSGLVQWAYAKAGIRIPRVTDQQILASGATKVGRDHLRPGDLVFFRDATGYVHHVGISLGGKRFIHAPHTGDVVKVSSLDEPYYAQQFTGGRRFDAVGSHVAARDVTRAHAALSRDAAEVARPGSGLFRAVEAQEEHKRNDAQVLPAIRPDQVTRRSRRRRP